jgi:bifunctional non-homologous end joining protein LigD
VNTGRYKGRSPALCRQQSRQGARAVRGGNQAPAADQADDSAADACVGRVAEAQRRALTRNAAARYYVTAMSLRTSPRPVSGFIEPCLPRSIESPPAGPGWVHEIKHDGFRIIAMRAREKVKLFSRRGNDFTDRFPAAVAAIAALDARSCILDGEAIVVDENGLSVFEMLRGRRHDDAALLCAFDVLEVDGNDLRRQPLETRKTVLSRLLRDAPAGVAVNAHYEAEGAAVYKHACALGCEGIVSKRLGSTYRSGRVVSWLKVKNPAAPAATREAEEDWTGNGRQR